MTTNIESAHQAIYENKMLNDALDNLLNALNIHFPGVKDAEYETGDIKTNFKDRLKFGIYLELIRAGFIK